ncbi:GGDEF domain-containing protein [Alteriqipengyuania lutimaris]|uniref:GGDEF domain-containing protein n=1 Tax=Alteriqipengyuania lutimaris TaxID=1538146 RepID=UPI001F34EF67|nr:diguanylate cyclase [Alteriqipengyuania lutimaris]
MNEDDGSARASSRSEKRARRRFLNDIRAFLIDHDLEVTPFNLNAAFEACQGLNPGLQRGVQARKESGLPITQSWLEETAAVTARKRDRSVQDLARELERGIEALTQATKTMRRATSEYGDELERRVDDLNEAPSTDQLLSNLADFAKAMLARSRETEEELRASEKETARLRENLNRARRDAEIDYLTGLPNRRAFEEAFKTDHARAATACEPLSVAFCDIDRFKAINDTHGHEAGDRIITEIGKSLAALCGRDCFLARHGGEEFVMLFRGVGIEEAFERLDCARRDLAQRRMINRRTDKPFGIVTFSAGIADVSQFDDPREALAAADRALYLAKEGGRNQIRLSNPPRAAG